MRIERNWHGIIYFHDGESVELTPETVVRVGPEAMRRITPGPAGMRLACSGGTIKAGLLGAYAGAHMAQEE